MSWYVYRLEPWEPFKSRPVPLVKVKEVHKSGPLLNLEYVFSSAFKLREAHRFERLEDAAAAALEYGGRVEEVP